jgi:chemotaxis signal transduction protein
MSDELGEHRARLAQAFDLGFALPFSSERPELRDFLVLRLGAHRYAVPVGELAGVQNRKTIQYLPDAPAHCLGLAGVRGRVGAIYDLGGLLGSPTSDRLSWFLQARLDPEIALLAPKPDRYLRVPVDRIVLCVETDGATVGALTDEELAINVLSVDRLIEAIRNAGRGRVA